MFVYLASHAASCVSKTVESWLSEIGAVGHDATTGCSPISKPSAT